MKLSKPLIESIKQGIEYQDMLDQEELEKLQKLRLIIGTDNIALGRLLVSCYDYLSNNLIIMLSDEENEYKELHSILRKIRIEDLREQLNDYGDGTRIGDTYIKIRIDRKIKDNREIYLELINLFFQIFGDDVI